MCSRNTVRESSHISFFCGGDTFCEVVRRLENTHDIFTWVTHRSLPSLERLVDLSPSLERPADLSFSPNLQTLYYLFKSHTDIWISSSPTYFSVYGLSELTYFRFFFRFFVDLIRQRKYLAHYPLAINYILVIIFYISLSYESNFVDVIFRPHWIC